MNPRNQPALPGLGAPRRGRAVAPGVLPVVLDHRVDLPRLGAAAAVVAVDLSYTSTGIAWLDVDGYLGVTTYTTGPVADPDRTGWAWAIRRRRIMLAVKRRLAPRVLLAKEDRISNLKVDGNSALDLAALHAMVDDAACLADAPVVAVNVGRVKVYGSGHGRADKPQQLAAAQREFGTRLVVVNDDEADALWTLAAVCHAAGHPIVKVTRRRAEVAAMVAQTMPATAVWDTEVMPAKVLSRLRSNP